MYFIFYKCLNLMFLVSKKLKVFEWLTRQTDQLLRRHTVNVSLDWWRPADLTESLKTNRFMVGRSQRWRRLSQPVTQDWSPVND